MRDLCTRCTLSGSERARATVGAGAARAYTCAVALSRIATTFAFRDMFGVSSWILIGTLAGVLSQFSPPSGDICPGSDIEFSCVGNSLFTSNTRWYITPNRGEEACAVLHNIPDEMRRCGTDRIFTSSLTGRTGLNYTSSLRAEDVPLSLNWTVVECVDGADLQTIGSYNICVIGKSELQLHTVLSILGKNVKLSVDE